MRHLVVGTAGHIDHGKSALVEALTGTHPDRLKEEKRRGITIELGFADTELADGTVLSFVDVPGHERFVRHMVAGATGIDAVLLVVAADEGVKPQTREHVAICGLLGLRHGAIALIVITNNQEALKNPPNPLSSILQIVLFMAITVGLWHRYGQTPGKKLAHIRVVDAKTLQRASYGKLSVRFVGYFLSLISIGGFFIGLFRRDKRALHDLLSGTAVITEA